MYKQCDDNKLGLQCNYGDCCGWVYILQLIKFLLPKNLYKLYFSNNNAMFTNNIHNDIT